MCCNTEGKSCLLKLPLLPIHQLYIVNDMSEESGYQHDPSQTTAATATHETGGQQATGTPPAGTETQPAVPPTSGSPAPTQTESTETGQPPQASPIEAQSTNSPTPAPQIERNPNAQSEEDVKWMVDGGAISPENLPLAANLSRDETIQLYGLYRTEAADPAQIDALMKLPTEEREQQSRQLLTEKLIKEGFFEEADRQNLLDQPSKELLYYLDELTPESETDAQFMEKLPPSTEGEVPSLKDVQNKDITDPLIAREVFEWTRRGGILDQALVEMEKNFIIQKIDQELDAEAEEYWSRRGELGEELKHRKLDGLVDESQKAEFIAAYRGQRLADPEYKAAREARIAAEMEGAQERVDILRGIVREGDKALEDDPTGEKKKVAAEAQKNLWQKLKEASPALAQFLVAELQKAGVEAVEAALTNDFGTFMRALLLAGHGYSGERYSGRAGYDADGNQLISKEHFSNMVAKPEQFGKALADAYQEDDFVNAGFKVKAELLQKAKEGDPSAIREVMESFLSDLFNGAETSDTLAKRWNVARRIIPEAMYPGKKVSFDDQMKEHLETMHKSIGESNGLFEKTFPAVEAAAGAEATEAEPGKDTTDVQPTDTTAGSQQTPQAA